MWNLTRHTEEALRARFGENVRFHELLKPYLHYRLGGVADVLVFPRDLEDLEWIRSYSRETSAPLSVIGQGTNLLVRDGGIRGVVVSLNAVKNDIEILESTPHETVVQCGAGVGKPQLLEWAVARGLAGLEFSAGVPGTLGGGIVMNAGTKYGCYADILETLTLFDFELGTRVLKRSEAHFGYREQTAVGNSIVWSMTFRLKPGDREAMQREVDRIIEERKEKQPLDYPSCGSTFKNPEGYSAGRLIEKAGLKGRRVGDAEISLKHANFFLNLGNAKSRDILDLIEIAKMEVWEKFQVRLDCEVILMGED